MSASAKKSYRPETRLVQSGTLRSPFGETSEALYLTQGYVYDSAAQAEARFKGEDPGYQYSRFANPTVDMFERRMAAFEGAEAARATASGMAAVTLSLIGQVKAGDHVVASKAMFGSCRYVVEDFLPRFGVASTLVDGCNLDAWRDAVRPNTKTFFLETPTNPALEVIDIAAVAKIAHEAGATLIVDNVFATPLFQSPLALGADCVVYSATMTGQPMAVTDDQVAKLERELGRAGLVELTYVIAVENERARFNHAPGITDQGFDAACRVSRG